MTNGGFKNLFPFLARLQFEGLQKGFVTVGRRGNQWRPGFDRAVACHPIKRITPAVFFEVMTPRLLQFVEKVDGLGPIVSVPGDLVKKCESHRVVRIRDRKPDCVMKKSSRRGQKRFE